MERTNISFDELKSLLSLSYLENWHIIDKVEEQVGIERIWFDLKYAYMSDDLEKLVLYLVNKYNIEFSESDITALKELRQ